MDIQLVAGVHGTLDTYPRQLKHRILDKRSTLTSDLLLLNNIPNKLKVLEVKYHQRYSVLKSFFSLVNSRTLDI